MTKQYTSTDLGKVAEALVKIDEMIIEKRYNHIEELKLLLKDRELLTELILRVIDKNDQTTQ